MATQPLVMAAESSAEWKACGNVRESREGRPVIRGHALIGEHAGTASSTRTCLEQRSVSPNTNACNKDCLNIECGDDRVDEGVE